MLVLTRKPGEQIVIDNNIRITIVSLGHGRVKIGIEAPPHVHIDRQEIHERKIAEESPKPIVVKPETEGPTAPPLHNRIAGKLPEPVAKMPVSTTDFRKKPR